IRARRNGTHSRRRTRCPLRQTSHCYRIIEGTPRRCKTSAARKSNDFQESAPPGQTRLKAEQEPEETIAHSLPRGERASQERAALRRLASRLVAPGSRRRPQTHQSRSVPCREESR